MLGVWWLLWWYLVDMSVVYSRKTSLRNVITQTHESIKLMLCINEQFHLETYKYENGIVKCFLCWHLIQFLPFCADTKISEKS